MKGVTITTSRESVAPASAEQWAEAETREARIANRSLMPMTPKRGRLIVIEGIDGSGKSTLALNLHGKLCSQFARSGLDNVILTREPYDPAPNGRDKGRIRAALQADSKVDPYQLAIMFAADRFAHLEDVVLPALESGRDVVCDRYTLSTLAYQTLKLPEEFVFQLVQAAPKPDITVLLDMDPQLARDRLLARGLPLESYERNVETQVALRENYLRYIADRRYFGDGETFVLPVNDFPAQHIAVQVYQFLTLGPDHMLVKPLPSVSVPFTRESHDVIAVRNLAHMPFCVTLGEPDAA